MIIPVSAVAASAFAAQDEQPVWNFDGDKPGAMTKGFTNVMGKWEVVADDTAPSKSNLLAQPAKSSGSTFNMTLVNDTGYKGVRRIWRCRVRDLGSVNSCGVSMPKYLKDYCSEFSDCLSLSRGRGQALATPVSGAPYIISVQPGNPSQKNGVDTVNISFSRVLPGHKKRVSVKFMEELGKPSGNKIR
jgi:hypothetical protein